jgi:hypothetical protein
VLVNNGNGLFQISTNYHVSGSPHSIAASDLNGDAYSDLAVTLFDSDCISILLNDGQGGFQLPMNYSVSDGPGELFASDFDGDEDIDLALALLYGGGIAILLNNGDGSFPEPVRYSAGSPESVFGSDLDGDGDIDLVVPNLFSWGISVILNNGNGSFGSSLNYGVGTNPVSVFASDLDMDGDNDLAVANSGSSSGPSDVSILTNLTTASNTYEDRLFLPYKTHLIAFPNPFNSSLTINYYVDKPSWIRIELYDILGRKLATLADKDNDVGHGVIRWDAGDISSGIYLLSMKAEDYSEIKKIAFLK